MGAVAVVMAGVATKETLEMSFVDNEKVVETLRSDGANEPFGKCVAVPGREGLQGLDALGIEHFVEEPRATAAVDWHQRRQRASP
jgi:hypothetical protein